MKSLKKLGFRRFNSLNGRLFLFTFIAINISALIVITTSFYFIEFPHRLHLSFFDQFLRIAALQFVIGLFFSVLSTIVYLPFRNQLFSDFITLRKYFLTQLSFLILTSIVVFFLLFYNIPLFR